MKRIACMLLLFLSVFLWGEGEPYADSLRAACDARDVTAIQKVIQAWHIDVNKSFNVNCLERTPAAFYILRSMRGKQDEVFKLLTDLGADWCAGDSRYLSPALYAVGFPLNLALMKILIEEYNLNPALPIEGGHSNLLILAAADGDMQAVRYPAVLTRFR